MKNTQRIAFIIFAFPLLSNCVKVREERISYNPVEAFLVKTIHEPEKIETEWKFHYDHFESDWEYGPVLEVTPEFYLTVFSVKGTNEEISSGLQSVYKTFSNFPNGSLVMLKYEDVYKVSYDDGKQIDRSFKGRYFVSADIKEVFLEVEN